MIVAPLHSYILEGAKGGVSSPGAHTRYSASQTVEFSRALEHIMTPFIPPEHEQAPEPAWETWKLHIAYYEK